MKIGTIHINISDCITGVYLRWWYNGFHYFNFTNGYEVSMKSENMDVQVTRMFSRISKIERPTKLKAEYSYQVTLSGITPGNIGGFSGLLLAEKVEQYENSTWYEVWVTRGSHIIQEPDSPNYILDFEITRKDRSMTSTVYQNPVKLYLGDTLCDMDDDEVVPVNKQVNDIAEMQDRQSDFTAQFKIRKTRAMKALFELSGEIGIITNYPYENKPCKLIQNGIELIKGGNCILDKVDEDYYYVAIYSGNLNFFKLIEDKKLIDLSLPSTNHTWNAITQQASNPDTALDYCYPMLEPSNDGGITSLPLTPPHPDRDEVWGGWIWPFIKAKAIWDEIFVNAEYTCQGDILTDEIFNKLFIPIVTRALSNIDIKPWLYSLRFQNFKSMTGGLNDLDCQKGNERVTLGDYWFKKYGIYITPYAANYTFRVILSSETSNYPSHVYLYSGGVFKSEFLNDNSLTAPMRSYKCTYNALGNEWLTFRVTNCLIEYYWLQIIDFTSLTINYGSSVTPRLHLPDLTQTDFIKMICNQFGLIPEANPAGKRILFWNYSMLYDNIPVARDWSAYLSETEDEVEFKFGDYAQNNYMRYKECDDVIKDTGTGIMKVEDVTLPYKKDVIEAPLSTCDEVTILTDVNVSRIDFNKYDEKSADYVQNDKIDPRIVFVDFVREDLGSPIYQKTFGFRTLLSGGTSYDVVTPRKASSLEVAFSSLSSNYGALSKMLDKTNLRRAKFNLPEYEVAGFKHYIPIYLSQYKAYFYVNKINNYVAGKLCIIDLIKL